ncbi:MAG: hypothetical protein OXH86_13500 [Acidimicrobiaceae bacterium]|nr:hypothetical protein [Acidimicrobiaceae bacterium]
MSLWRGDGRRGGHMARPQHGQEHHHPVGAVRQQDHHRPPGGPGERADLLGSGAGGVPQLPP